LDIVNSQPTILLGLMRKFGYPENKMPTLCDYINRREELLPLVDSDRFKAKQKVLSVFYGGARDDVPEFCKSLAREVDAIADTLKVAWCRDHPTYRERDKHGVLAIMLRDVEKSCLFAMEKVLRRHGRQFMTYIHDGGLVRKLDNEKMFPQQLLNECEACVREMGYELRLQVKPLEAPYRYIKREREDKFLLDENGCLVEPLTDLLTAEYFLHMYGQTNFVSVQHVLYMFDKQTGMWTSSEAVIRRAITNADIVLKTPTQEGLGVSHFISANVKSTELLLKKLVDIAPLDDSFFKDRLESAKGKLLFRNGILDMQTRTFSSDFDPSIVFFHAIPRAFNEERNEEHIAYLRRMLFVEPFSTQEVGLAYLHYLMRGVIGDFRMRKLVIAVGPTSSSKGTVCELLSHALGGFSGAFLGDSLLTREGSSHEATKTLSWVDTIYNRRIAYSNEINSKKGQSLNGKLLDMLCSGGDEIQIRRNRVDEYAVINQSMIMLFVNNVPVIDPLNDSTLSRLVTIPFEYSFVDNPTLPYEKKRDPNFKTALCDNHQFRDAFIHLIMDECRRWLVWKDAHPVENEMPLPPECALFKRDLLEPQSVGDLFDIFQQNFEITGNEHDRIQSIELSDALEDICGRALTTIERRQLFQAFNIREKQVKERGRNAKYRTGLKRINF
jgi:hypothetical protein